MKRIHGKMTSSWIFNMLAALFVISCISLAMSSVMIPKKTLQELISKALIETMATKQRNLLDEYYESQSQEEQTTTTTAINPDTESSDTETDPEEMAGFFEGDMAGINDELGRVGINFQKFPTRKWKNNTVHYIISPLYLPDEYMIIKTAVRILNFFTCVDFKEWDGIATDYLVFWPVEKPAGCWSYVGRLGGPQIVSLQPPDLRSPQCFAGIGRPLHETMHALGVYHEQSRPDRDKFVTVMKKNVIRGFVNNFDKVDAKNATFPFEYDYDSIMHYGTTFFSRNKKNATLVPKVKNKRIGQRINLSRLDCKKLNYLYGCFEKSPFDKRKYTTICNFLGL